jgi:hypothetical protein
MCTFFLGACGYTVLNTSESHKQTAEPIENGLPDIVITEIFSGTLPLRTTEMNHTPPWTTTFFVQVHNIGTATFKGLLLISYADKIEQITKGGFPLNGRVKNYTMKPGDSTQIELQHVFGIYPSGTHLRFIVRTDSYPEHSFDPIYYFGREAVKEVSSSNNTFDYDIP